MDSHEEYVDEYVDETDMLNIKSKCGVYREGKRRFLSGVSKSS